MLDEFYLGYFLTYYIYRKELAIGYLLRCRQHKSRQMKNDLLGVTSKVY